MRYETVLKVENLSKKFKIYESPLGRIKEWLTFGRNIHHKNFTSLENISFEVRRGGFLGIIGPNGAGKSTLLKVITGVLEPTSGSIEVGGKILSLLELSGGMDLDLTGRENLIRSSQLLGFPSGYLEDRMPQIAEFAELGDFFDQALGVYSSGMRIRLAFSMFAFFECDVLILDEVLAVGDIFFRQKCYARLEELVAQNVAIILVTHSTGTVRQYCDDVIVLDKGKVIFHGDSGGAIQKYFEIKKSQGVTINISDTYAEEDAPLVRDKITSKLEIPGWPVEKGLDGGILPWSFENDRAKMTQLSVRDEKGNPIHVFEQGATAYFYFAIEIKENLGVPIARLNLLTVKNLLIHSKSSMQLEANHPLAVKKGDTIRYRQSIKLDLAPGNYIFNFNLSAMHPSDFKQREVLSPVDLKEKIVTVIDIKSAGAIEVIRPALNKSFGLHGGICNLDGEAQIQIV